MSHYLSFNYSVSLEFLHLQYQPTVMKTLLTSLAILLVYVSCSQSPEAIKRQQQVENNLCPEVIYGDSMPRLTIEGQMKLYRIRGVSVAVIKDYKIDWAKGYGWADEEEKRPVTTDTRFQAASISKSLNSVGVMKLVQQGKINLDSDINTYLKTWKFPYDSISHNKKITVRNLLTHTAGLTVHGFRGYTTTDLLPTIPQILNGEKPANSPAVRSQFEPSLRFKYSGGGTTISQLIVTDVTGQRYEDFMKKNVLDPLGMTNSSYAQPSQIDPKYLATAYYGGGGNVKGKYHVYPEQAAAGLWTTPTDLAKYIIETQLAYEGKSSKVLSPAFTQQRLTFYVDSAAALGSFLVRKEGQVYFTHNGGNEGFACTSFGSLRGGNGVVVMTNADNFAIIPEIVNSVAKVYGWKGFYTPTFRKVLTLSADTLQAYSGNYLAGKDTISFSVRDNALYVQQNSQPANGYKLLFNTSATAWIKEVPGVKIGFVFDADGKVNTITIDENGQKVNCPRIN
jgi:CubicO group peptidase (beta-lactamase class C family)